MSRLARNVVYNIVGQGLVLVLTFIAVRYIFHRLGTDAFGVIYFSIVLTTVVTSALELGISSTTVREISRHGESDITYVTDLIRTASFFYWAGGGVLLVVIYLGAPLLVAHWITLTSMRTEDATLILRILGISVVVALPRVLYSSVIRGRQRMSLTNGIDVVTNAGQQAGTVIILLVGGGIAGIAIWLASVAVISTCVYAYVAARIFGWKSTLPKVSATVVRINRDFTIQMGAISLLSQIHSQADKIVVSKFLSVAQFGLYGFAASTVGRATLVAWAAAQAALPSFSSLFYAGDRTVLLTQYRKLQDLVTVGTLPVFAGICFAALPVYRYVFNDDAAHTLLLPTIFLALGSYMNGTLSVLYVLSLAVGHPEIATRQNALALVIVLPMTIGLIHAFGLSGAGFSWVVYHAFAYLYSVPRIYRKCLQSDPWGWYRNLLQVTALGAMTYGVAAMGLALTGSSSSVVLGLALASASGLFILGSATVVSSESKKTLLRLIHTVTRNGADIRFG